MDPDVTFCAKNDLWQIEPASCRLRYRAKRLGNGNIALTITAFPERTQSYIFEQGDRGSLKTRRPEMVLDAEICNVHLHAASLRRLIEEYKVVSKRMAPKVLLCSIGQLNYCASSHALPVFAIAMVFVMSTIAH
jgi:hypothetical protein